MTKAEWIEEAKANKGKLLSIIRQYHPAAPGEKKELKITAALAEAACEGFREEIRAKGGDPVAQFEAALEAADYKILYDVLDETWIGIPESMDSWNVEGFKEAVELLEDPPETEDDSDV